ncbi:MAG: peptidoglycan editing factor PgeF [Ignavibacteriae bacterium]|nr:MAG: peptidoglycan editing factor PgeF [Ignavibacteriota bacterium]
MEEKETIIRSKLLSSFPEIVHAMSTMLGGCENPPFFNNLSYRVGDDEGTVKQNRDKFFNSLGIENSRLAIPQQVHSANVRIVDVPGYYKDFDALITSKKDVYLIISTADCYPVLVYDKVNKIVSAIHSGWRGTQKKILTNAIAIMTNELGSRAENLVVFIGPGISKDKFEVGKEVAEMFEDKYVYPSLGKYYIDLKSNILDQLASLGVSISNIEFSGLCTYCEEDYLHSYRRDRESSGRMFSVIGMKGN